MVYENWVAWAASSDATTVGEAVEFALFTDAHITGEITKDCGPYQFLNTVPGWFDDGRLTTPIVVRVDEALSSEDDLPRMDSTDDARYHAGSLYDEIAAGLRGALHRVLIREVIQYPGPRPIQSCYVLNVRWFCRM
jgi:hypothetical protein